MTLVLAQIVQIMMRRIYKTKGNKAFDYDVLKQLEEDIESITTKMPHRSEIEDQ